MYSSCLRFVNKHIHHANCFWQFCCSVTNTLHQLIKSRRRLSLAFWRWLRDWSCQPQCVLRSTNVPFLMKPLGSVMAFCSHWRHLRLFQFSRKILEQFFLLDPSRHSNIIYIVTLLLQRFYVCSIMFFIWLCFYVPCLAVFWLLLVVRDVAMTEAAGLMAAARWKSVEKEVINRLPVNRLSARLTPSQTTSSGPMRVSSLHCHPLMQPSYPQFAQHHWMSCSVTGRFAHGAFRPMDVSPKRWTIRPLDDSPHGRFAP